MHRVSIAEWVVARFTGKKRAASIVGDLLELEPQKGPLWFWLSLTKVVVSLAWRGALAFVAAVFVYFAAFGISLLMSWLHLPFRTVPDGPWRIVWGVLCLAGNILWFMLAYAAIHYGVRDRVTQLALALAPLITAGVYGWSQPVILVACVTLSLCVIVALILDSERRRAALVLLLVVMAGFGGFLLTGSFAALYQQFVHHGPTGDGVMQGSAPVLWVEFCMLFFMTPWIMTVAFSRMHRWVRRNPLLDLDA
jgi:hypothetical protein